MKYLVFCMLLVSSAGRVSAQTGSPASTKPVPPRGALLSPAPDYSQWVITYQYGDDPKKGQNVSTPSGQSPTDVRPRRAVTTKTGQVIHEQLTDLAGRTSDNWFVDGKQYTKLGGEASWLQPRSRAGSDDLLSNPIPRNGFRGFEYVNASNYFGMISCEGKECLVFVPNQASKNEFSDLAKMKKFLETQTNIAYIAADTRMPIAQRVFSEVRVYQFGDTPTTMQTLPADLIEQLKKADESRSILEARAPRP